MNQAPEPLGPRGPLDRREEAYQRRKASASALRTAVIYHSKNNGDDGRYAERFASHSKGLPHDPTTGEVVGAAYDRLLAALQSGDPQDFERIPLGSARKNRKLVNPLCGLAFDTQGADPRLLAIPPAPQFASAEEAAEIVENYWMALLRDVPFVEYPTNPLARQAADELSELKDFTGPRDPQTGTVTPRVLFRGGTAGALVGPYISQFLLLNVPFGALGWEQRMLTPKPRDYMTTWDDWLAVQNGEDVSLDRDEDFQSDPVFLRNGRDLAQWVHVDVLFQAYFNACLILLQGPRAATPVGGGLGAPFDPGNPYLGSKTMAGFGTFGGPHYITLLCEVATRALKAIWFQKWYVHRRLRPEVFGGRIHATKTGTKSFPIDAQALNSIAVQKTFDEHGSYLLPQAFPEGSPTHPAYGAGHATVAGACVTILKALFDESTRLKDLRRGDFAGPVTLDDSGSPVPYTGPDADELTVGGELNKLASNIAIGRNIAGVHWRTDASAAMRLGEQIAIGLLRDQRHTYFEDFRGWTLTQFDGTTVTV